MATNPFKVKPPKADLKRNTFDLSHTNHVTGKFGKLYPVMMKEVIPGDSVSMQADMFFKTMPMVFPTMTRMRAHLSFFYVRNRNLWDGFKDFITDTKSHVHPYLQINDVDKNKRLGVGSLLDYLDVPCSIVASNENQSWNTSLNDESVLASVGIRTDSVGDHSSNYNTNNFYFTSDFNLNSIGKNIASFIGDNKAIYSALLSSDTLSLPLNNSSTFKISTFNGVSGNASGRILVFEDVHDRSDKFPHELILRGFSSALTFTYNATYKNLTTPALNVSSVKFFNDRTTTAGKQFITGFNELISKGLNLRICICLPALTGVDKTAISYGNNLQVTNLTFVNAMDAGTMVSPFTGTTPAIKLSALPARAYEYVYNCYYRDQQNNPLMIDGQPDYNTFLEETGDGADTHYYDLHNVNWEQDFLTTAMASPQQGIAPLLGARTTPRAQGILHYTNEAQQTGTIRLDWNPQTGGQNDGDNITLISNLGGEDQAFTALQEAVNFGISINDLRSVGALQKWLEKNMRRGFRYKEQMESHFGISLSLEELDMAEYLGGSTCDITSTAIINTGTELGEEAGRGLAIDNMHNRINHFFDEHGFLCAFVYFTPLATYSQLLPKHYLKTSVLDYFTPEFNFLPPQPITYKEVCPLQANQDGVLDKTFGYQRAWYDYLASVDTIHGQFRTTLKDYIVNRTFASAPQLGKNFVEVNDEDCNQIFVETGSDDKIFGQIHFDIQMKRPIAMFGEPRLDC